MRLLLGLVLLCRRRRRGVGKGPGSRAAMAERAHKAVVQRAGPDVVSQSQIVCGTAAVCVVHRRLNRQRQCSSGPASQPSVQGMEGLGQAQHEWGSVCFTHHAGHG